MVNLLVGVLWSSPFSYWAYGAGGKLPKRLIGIGTTHTKPLQLLEAEVQGQSVTLISTLLKDSPRIHTSLAHSKFTVTPTGKQAGALLWAGVAANTSVGLWEDSSSCCTAFTPGPQQIWLLCIQQGHLQGTHTVLRHCPWCPVCSHCLIFESLVLGLVGYTVPETSSR